MGPKSEHGAVYGARNGICRHCGGELDTSGRLCSRCGSPQGRAARHAVKAIEQLGIPLWPLDRRGRTIEERYAEWRQTEHGREVYGLFRRFAYEVLASGRKRFSQKAIVERIRWYVEIEAQSPDSFRCNDHMTSRMVRELIGEDARFGDLFETRKLRSP